MRNWLTAEDRSKGQAIIDAAVCPTCDGAGERETGRTEPVTGYPMTVSCPTCDGSGEMPLTADETCFQCSAELEGDEEIVCAGCRSENARDMLADNAYDSAVEDGL